MVLGKVRALRRYSRKISLNIQVITLIVFALFILLQWRRRTMLILRITAVSETLKIYGQMQNYSGSVCASKSFGSEDINVNLRPPNKVYVSKEKVNKDVTIIFISQPNLKCAETRLKELQNKYPAVQVILAFESLNLSPKQYSSKSYPVLQTVLNMGGFSSYPEAVLNSVLVVKTKYFVLLDSQIAIREMPSNFVQTLMGYIDSFQLIGGSLVNVHNEFIIPCHSLRLRNWTFFEKFEYNVSGPVLKCESVLSYFLAETGAVQSVFNEKLLDMGILWRQDFFLHVGDTLSIGILPEIIFKQDAIEVCAAVKMAGLFNTKHEIDSLLPFVNKYHVLDFVDVDGNHTSICDGSDPMICSEKYIFPKWRLRHWAYSGLTAFPFIVQRLIDALRFGIAQLEKNNIRYVLEGGTLLGFIKIRAVLPWDSGDVDTFVFSNRRPVINLVKQIKEQYGYEYLLRWNAFHVYVTPYYPMHDGLIVYAASRDDPGEMVNIRMHGRLFLAPRSIFKFAREHYGSSYLESRIRFGDERVSCDYKGYHACMPDCRWDGCGSGHGQFPGILL